MAIDKELVKQVMSAKTPRNFAFVEGSEDKMLLVSKAKIAEDALETAVKKCKAGKVTVKGTLQLEGKEEGGQKVVFFIAKPLPVWESKFRRALKEHAGLSKEVEVRKPQGKVNEDNAPQNDQVQGGNVEGQNEQGEPGQFENAYQELYSSLEEEIEALKVLNPKAAVKVQSKLQEIKNSLDENDLTDARFKPAVKSLRKLTANVEKLPRKGTKEGDRVQERAAYKSLRERLAPLAQQLAPADRATYVKAMQLAKQADLLAGDDVPEEGRNYGKGMKLLEKVKKLLEAGLKKAGKENKQLGTIDKNKGSHGAQFKQELRDAKEQLASLTRQAPQAPELPELNESLKQAATFGRQLEFGAGLQKIRDVATRLKEWLGLHVQAQHRIDLVKSLISDASNQTAPSLPDSLIKTFNDYAENVEKLIRRNSIDQAHDGLKGLEEHVRKSTTERKMFTDSVQGVDRLMGQLLDSLTDEAAEGFETRYLEAFTNFENLSPMKGYDEMTKLEADLQVALRKLPQDVKVPKSNQVDGTSQAPEIQKGTSKRARKFKFKLNVENVRRSFTFLGKKVPEDLIDFENRLQSVLKKNETNFDDAEQELEGLVKDLNKVLTRVRESMPTKKKEDYPPRRPLSPAPKRPPETLERWKERIDVNQLTVNLDKQIAKGGQGAIYSIDSTDPNAPPLVIKLPLDGFEHTDDLDKESKNYEKIGEHPNVIKSFGITEVNGKRGLVLEKVRGGGFDSLNNNLKTRLAKGEISQSEYWSSVQYTISKTMEVLDFLHDQGFAHNDIKPENIMIDSTTGDVKVIDLGVMNEKQTKIGETSPIYQAPESVDSVSSEQTDVFSTGASLYQTQEGEEYHYGDKKKMSEAKWKTEIEKIVKAYGDFSDDPEAGEMAIQQQDEENPIEHKVDSLGQQDPQGTNKRKNAGVSAGKSAYTEFMNWLLHPDPKKRPSAKEAMQHPFLRDRILDDDKIRELNPHMDSTEPVATHQDPFSTEYAALQMRCILVALPCARRHPVTLF